MLKIILSDGKVGYIAASAVTEVLPDPVGTGALLKVSNGTTYAIAETADVAVLRVSDARLMGIPSNNVAAMPTFTRVVGR